jgi:tetratricopeptide (TPR) repeat protein
VARRSGFESVLDEKPETFPTAFPMSQVALYAGWYDSQVSGPFAQPKVEFMPGAIAYHLHSYSAGSVRTATQHWVGPLLAKGATATLGCVDEPYLTYTPDLGVLFSRLIQWAFSFGEAAYAAQRAVSWQITVIGDPLYRPFGQKPQVMQEELERRESPLLEWCHLRRVNVSLATDLPVADLVLYLEQLPLTRRSALLEQKLGELQLRQGQKDEAVTEFQKALRLQPSPQQRIQLQLTLAGTLAELARETESLEVYRELLKETPNYPDLLGIYQKMLALARKSGNEEVSRRCEAELMRLSGQKPAL